MHKLILSQFYITVKRFRGCFANSSPQQAMGFSWLFDKLEDAIEEYESIHYPVPKNDD